MNSKETVAVLGAGGTMGFAMARNLAGNGFAVRAWNRSREKAEPLSEDGAEVFDSPAEAVAGAEVILTMLTDGDAVIAAMQGELIVLASGPERVRDRVEPIFAVVGQRSMWVGEAGAGSQLKLVTNGWLVTVVEGCAESLALAEGFGLDPQLLLDAVQGGPLDLPYLQMKGKAMIERKFDPSFKLRHAAKDAALVQESARSRDLDLPLVNTIHERLDQAAREHGDEDVSATFLLSAPGG